MSTAKRLKNPKSPFKCEKWICKEWVTQRLKEEIDVLTSLYKINKEVRWNSSWRQRALEKILKNEITESVKIIIRNTDWKLRKARAFAFYIKRQKGY